MAEEQTLRSIIKALKSTSGDEFFNTITLQLHNIIGADYTFIAKLDTEKYVSKTISLVAKGTIADNFEYSLKHTPCADVSEDSTCIYPQNICQLYPQDQLLIDMNIEGYLGAPLHSSDGKVMGLVVGLFEKPIPNSELVANLFELFSGRISAEIERTEKEVALQTLNEQLEQKVTNRTQKLQTALTNLEQAQEQIIEQERLASLGSLVAGVAHEINTPLGVAVLSNSHLNDLSQLLLAKIDGKKLTKQELLDITKDIASVTESLSHNLQRAADLVRDFKQVAVENNTNELIEFEFHRWLDAVVSSIAPLLNQHHIIFTVSKPENAFTLTTYAAKLTQVLVNLINNAVEHAFKDASIAQPEVTLKLSIAEQQLVVEVADNGKGIPIESQKKIFDPFYTTARNQGGTGLGLHIVHNIVYGVLQGTIELVSAEQQGSCFTVTIPMEIQ